MRPRLGIAASSTATSLAATSPASTGSSSPAGLGLRKLKDVRELSAASAELSEARRRWRSLASEKKRPTPAEPPVEIVSALHAYAGQRSGDLSFAAGDRITVVSKKANGWWIGFVDDPSAKGEFPSNYVSPPPPRGAP